MTLLSSLALAPPAMSLRWIAVWARNFLVWRKLAFASLVGNFGDPFLYLLGIGYGLGGFVGPIQGMSYLLFFASGLVCSSAMNTATFEGLYSAFTRINAQRTWDGMLATPLIVDDIVMGEIMWAATKSVISSSIILVVAALLGVVHDWTALWAIGVIFLVGLCFGAMALWISVLSPSYDFFLYYFTLVVTPMFLFSGVFFPVDALPAPAQGVAWLLPLTHAIAIVRPLMAGLSVPDLGQHLMVLTAYGVAFSYLTMVGARRKMTL
jgi:lipooligosaccharide transport system permease protein